MKNLIIILLIFSFGCKSQNKPASEHQQLQTTIDSIFRIENFSQNFDYRDSCCLLFNNLPFLKIGQSLDSLSVDLSLGEDPNSKYMEFYPTIVDYGSSDVYFLIKQETGSITGTVYLSVDSLKKRIFRFGGDWLFDIEINETSKIEAIDLVTTKYFPCLKGRLDFNNNETIIVEHQYFSEIFKLMPPNSAHNQLTYWWLSYKVVLK